MAKTTGSTNGATNEEVWPTAMMICCFKRSDPKRKPYGIPFIENMQYKHALAFDERSIAL